MDYLEKARAVFSADRFATEATGITIDDVSPGYARCSVALDSRHVNAAGGIMGGVMFTLADFAFAVAANIEETLTVALTSQITYLSGVKGKLLTAEARCVKAGRSTCFYQVDITDDVGTAVACVAITGFIKRG